ncbi:MAG: hypothetical protein CMG35_04140 [Candidatus Marinimicrobia bacterium]|jgi:hypothetical protein|nr:hypothetical protein [Candidatus Neomarinimicrobiota bacterium]|tara:strand:- start:719 stop:964 length:246 start_codon:yes stop_codon:yes gene_type:complete
MLNGTIKIVAIILGVLWTIAAIPPVINTYYYLDELSCTDDGCDNYEIWDNEEELLGLQNEIDILEQRLAACTALVEERVKK